VTAATIGDATATALATMTNGNEALQQLSLMYARAYEENPAAAFGMLACTLTMVQQQVSDIHGVVGAVREKVQPYIDNPDELQAALFSALPPNLRALFGG
jgi:ribulose kinase